MTRRWLGLGALVWSVVSVTGCAPQETATHEPLANGSSAAPAGGGSAASGAEVQTASGLRYRDVVEGQGEVAKEGQTAVVDYVGTLVDGTQFDTSLGKKPFDFKLGAGQVVKGWDEGVPGMKVGGKRELRIPAALGYGAEGHPPTIPPNATLLFTVELKELK